MNKRSQEREQVEIETDIIYITNSRNPFDNKFLDQLQQINNILDNPEHLSEEFIKSFQSTHYYYYYPINSLKFILNASKQEETIKKNIIKELHKIFERCNYETSTENQSLLELLANDNKNFQAFLIKEIILSHKTTNWKKYLTNTLIVCVILTAVAVSTLVFFPATLTFMLSLITPTIQASLSAIFGGALLTAYTIHSAVTDKSKNTNDRQEEALFAIMEIPINIAAYTVWIATAVVGALNPLSASLFVLASTLQIFKDLHFLNKQNKFNSGRSDNIANFLTQKQKINLTVNFIASILNAGIMTLWCFATIPAITPIALILIKTLMIAKFLIIQYQEKKLQKTMINQSITEHAKIQHTKIEAATAVPAAKTEATAVPVARKSNNLPDVSQKTVNNSSNMQYKDYIYDRDNFKTNTTNTFFRQNKDESKISQGTVYAKK